MGVETNFEELQEKIDKVICDWSMRTQHNFEEDELDSLVDAIAEELKEVK